MITGVHALIYSKHPDKVRAFFKDVLGLESVDSGGDWPIFALPPAELGIHPSEDDERTELYLLCDDVEAAVSQLEAKGVKTTGPVRELDWGRLVLLEIAEGVQIGMYQPKHPSPLKPRG
jgi:predicted enzyme related to lactoylglutathione lyase